MYIMQDHIYEVHNTVLHNASALDNLGQMYTEGNIIADLKTASEKERLLKVTHFFLMTMQAGLSIHYTVILHCYS